MGSVTASSEKWVTHARTQGGSTGSIEPPQPEPRPTMVAIIRTTIVTVLSRYLFLNLNDYFGMCPLGGLNDYIGESIISTPTVRLSLKRRSLWMLISHFDSLRLRFVKITIAKRPPHGHPHATVLVRGGICPPVENGNVEGSKNHWYWLPNDG